MSQEQASFALVADGTDYALRQSGDGTQFLLQSKADHLSAHLQGDDAARFLADYNAVKLQFPAGSADQWLAQLWDQGGYSWLAAQDEA